MKKKLIKVDRNGTKYYLTESPCIRCGGAGGSDAWAYTGWTCYECGGTGKGKDEIIKEYTPEYEAKLAERREKRRQKWLEEHADEIKAREEAEQARKAQEEAERKAAEEKAAAEAKAEAERKARSQHIGNEGDKLDLIVTFEKMAWFEVRSFSGYGFDTKYVYTFRDENGNAIVWKTTANIGNWNEKGDWEMYEEGQKVHLKGTIKAHTEYKDEKQTEMTRCKITK